MKAVTPSGAEISLENALSVLAHDPVMEEMFEMLARENRASRTEAQAVN